MSDRICALHLVNGEFYAGAERVQDLLALKLPELGIDVEFASLKAGQFLAKRLSQNAPLTPITMASRLDFGAVDRLADLLRSGRFDLLHTHTPRGALIGSLAAAQTAVPMVHHVHSPANKDTEHVWRNWRNSLIEQFSLRKARVLIPVSASLAVSLRSRGFKPELIKLVPNGVPIQPKNRLTYVPGSQLIITTVALFRPRKGIEVLLESLAMLNSSGLDIALRAIGPFEATDYQNSVMQLAASLGISGKVHWTGFTSDVAAELAQAHLFVLPSLFGEGMPMVVLEAMSAGLPIIASNVEGIPEVVRDTRDGLIVAPGDVSQLVEAIRQIYCGDYNAAELGDNAWLRQRAIFSDSKMAESIAEIYREVM